MLVNIDNHCDICNGLRFLNSVQCTFCNGTGEQTKASKAFYKHHLCLCAGFDRKTCSLCKQKCHHTTSLKQKVLIH